MNYLQLLNLKTTPTVHEVAQLLTQGKAGIKEAESLIGEAIEAGELRANIERWGRYYADLGTELPGNSTREGDPSFHAARCLIRVIGKTYTAPTQKKIEDDVASSAMLYY